MKGYSNREIQFARDIRKKRIITFLLFISYVPSILLIDFIFNSKFLFGLTITVYLLLILWLSFKWLNAICPRCGKRFFSRFIANPFTSKCMHCDLSISKNFNGTNGVTS